MSSQRRRLTGPLARVVTVVTVAYCIYTLLYIGHIFDRFGIYIDLVSQRALFLAFLTALTFLTLPATRSYRDKLPWYDIVFLALGVAGPLYVFIFYDGAGNRFAFGRFYPYEIVLAGLTLLSVLEIARRVVGAAQSIIAVVFLLHMWLGKYLPGDFYVSQPTLGDAVHFMVYSSEGIYGTILGVASTLIITFIIFGQFMQSTPLGQFFFNMAMAALGHVRGGPAKVAVVASMLFGTLSGSANANVAATGTFTIPMMKSIGYRANFAGAVESVASSGGQIMPPIMGTTAFLIAQFLNISYWQVVVAAFLPALLYYFGLFVAVDAEAVKGGLIGMPRDRCPSAMKTLKEGWLALVPLAVLVVLLGGLRFDASTSALYALVVLIAISMARKKTRLKGSDFVEVFKGSARGTLPAGNACACAGIIVGAVMITQFGIRLSDIMIRVAGGDLLLLLVLASILTYLLGTGLPAVPSYIMVVVLLAPALVKFGIPPLAAHMFVFYWVVISFFTPPTASAVFTACGISGGDPLRTGLESMKISVATYIVAFMLIYRQELLLLKGTPLESFIVFVVCAIGVAFLAWGLAGFALSKKLNAWQRMFLVVGGVILFLPYLASNVAGLAMGGSVFAWTRVEKRLRAARGGRRLRGLLE